MDPALKEPVAFRPIEANVIINLPSVEVPSEKTLTFLVTHRFVQNVQQGNINNFFTLDNGNTWGFGLWYAPVKNLNIGLYRSSNLATVRGLRAVSAPVAGRIRARRSASARTGARNRASRPRSRASSPRPSWRTPSGQYVRIYGRSDVPAADQRLSRSFLSRPDSAATSRVILTDNSFNPYRCSGLYENVFNVPIAASIAITHSITIHGEVIPRLSKVNSNGVGWSVSVEKSLLRHRFAFFAGNQRQTTVDEYTQAVPMGQSPSNIYLGFNLFRAWNFK